MEAIFFLLVSIGCLMSVSSLICTDSTKCMWKDWAAWGPCHSNFSQTRLRLACCPENLQPKTIEACLKVCNVSHPGNMHMKDYHGHRNCTGIICALSWYKYVILFVLKFLVRKRYSIFFQFLLPNPFFWNMEIKYV